MLTSSMLFSQENTALSSEIYTLEMCLERAKLQSRSALKAQLQVQRANLQLDQEKRIQMPNLQFETQSGWQFGRTIDPTTNSFNSEGIMFNSAGLTSSWVLYQGGKAAYAKAHRQDLLRAAEANEAQVDFQLELEVTNAYLNILLAKEYIQQLKSAREATSEQLRKVEQDIRLGVRPLKDSIQIASQIASENRNLIDAEQRLDQAKRALKQLLRLGVDQPIKIQEPADWEWEESIEQKELALHVETALQRYPAYQAAIAQAEATERRRAILKAERLPSIVMFGQINTQFSSGAQEIAGYDQQLFAQEVLLEGQPSTLTVMQSVPEYAKSPLFQQWKNNFGQAVGIQLSFPVLDQSRNKTAQQEAVISSREAQINIQEQKDWFIYELDRVKNRWKTAQATFEAAQASVILARKAYDMAQEAYQAGGVSGYELLETKKQLNTEQARALQAKFDCLFARKILSSFHP